MPCFVRRNFPVDMLFLQSAANHLTYLGHLLAAELRGLRKFDKITTESADFVTFPVNQ
ncbi:MAG: hypothetical protein ABIO84_02985 [Lysobacter sp.]